MPENKAPLHQPSFAFSGSSISSLLRVPFPGEPSPCPAHYRLAFDYYVAAALSPACWHFRILFRVKRFESSLSFSLWSSSDP
jgi:hypothetical protein